MIKWHRVVPFNFFYALATEAEIKAWAKKIKRSIELPEDCYGYAATLQNRTLLWLIPRRIKNIGML